MSSPIGAPITSEHTTHVESLRPQTQLDGFTPSPLTTYPPRPPSLRNTDSVTSAAMSASSSPLGALNAARRPGLAQSPPSSARSGVLPQDMQAKMKAFHLSRQGVPPPPTLRMTSVPPESLLTSAQIPASAISVSGDAINNIKSLKPGGALVAGNSSLMLPPSNRPSASNFNSAPVVPNLKMAPRLSLAAKRGLNQKMKLSDASSPITLVNETGAGAGGTLGTNECAFSEKVGESSARGKPESMFSKYSEFVDTKTGSLKFEGKAIIHGKGIEFSSGTSFSISLDEVDNLEELGKGNYGTVYRVRHSRPRMRRPGLGLNSIKHSLSQGSPSINTGDVESGLSTGPGLDSTATDGSTGMIMAMKEIRLELDEAKFAAIIMELDILHRCISPFIVDFYGAFFQEGAVYICMEFMDGGSIDKLYGNGIPEGVLRKITMSTVMGLKTLKDDHNIIHRDVKPTNILVNRKGQVKICDFGVSGNLVASIAKTNIGCQSYMAPERIASGGVAQAGANPGGGTYSVQSDIWSLGLSIIECGMGQYPYPPETYNNIFSQLSAIVDGDPPDLPAQGFSSTARDFVRGCLNKTPKLRPTYAMLLRHPWLAPLLQPPTISEEDEESTRSMVNKEFACSATTDEEVAQWVCEAMERRQSGTMKKKLKPALHAAPLNAVSSPSSDIASAHSS